MGIRVYKIFNMNIVCFLKFFSLAIIKIYRFIDISLQHFFIGIINPSIPVSFETIRVNDKTTFGIYGEFLFRFHGDEGLKKTISLIQPVIRLIGRN
ncbi:hypothetical protein SDC9_170497 [bioreactor metagenome]|uniref:Uncharacterized protein n=1 Tax=bioreactor metagenome TaxID=1076179 RepID=A0A645GAV8_9ZZZZ